MVSGAYITNYEQISNIDELRMCKLSHTLQFNVKIYKKRQKNDKKNDKFFQLVQGYISGYIGNFLKIGTTKKRQNF